MTTTTKKTSKPPARDKSKGDEISRMTLRERVQKIREVVTYIRRTELGGNAPYKSAVSHDAIIEKVRPHLVEYKIAWQPIDIEILQTGVITTANGREQKWCQAKVTVRFYCTDEEVGERKDGSRYDHIDIPVISEGLDGQDKGSAKLMTYADKSALMWLLNLQRGDDPDFDRLAPGSGADEDITRRVNDIRTLYENHPDFKDSPAAGIQGYLVRLARSRGRHRVPTMYDLSEDQLDNWIAELTEEVKKHGGSHGRTTDGTER